MYVADPYYNIDIILMHVTGYSGIRTNKHEVCIIPSKLNTPKKITQQYILDPMYMYQ